MSIQNGYHIGVTEKMLHPLYREAFPATIDGPDGPEPHLPIGSDGGGNAFLLATPSGHVYQWNHENGQVKRVADSFGAFLAKVAVDWEHYIANDHQWRYLV